ncbi:hypothetical protein GIY62_14810 [Burkholderia plantarii]|uniref:hypothetical protein n=1 Tax=Burkholderia plantarii TaxID=41899 RepID=UPI002729FB96|nr:hypothetical protein [Burkholderia plantarii]WLE58398.1 hypothetical protein GIY62_14810 [Burkholderia plantarii]
MASILPNGRVQFIDQNGKPLVGGSVAFFEPGTTTKADTYQDVNLSIVNQNPVPLDSRGQALIWGNTNYRQIVKDVNGVTIWDQVVSAAVSFVDLADSGADLIQFDGLTFSDMFKSRLNRVVDSIAELRTLSKLVYTRAHATGYYAPHDDGGGTYQLDPNDNTSVDNGGTVIKANDGGRWKLQTTGSVTAKQFGARGDGVVGTDNTSGTGTGHNDTLQVQNFLAALSPTLAGYLTMGVYNISAQLTKVANNITILTDGAPNTVINWIGAATDQDFMLLGQSGTDTKYWCVGGIGFESATKMTAGAGIHCQQFMVRNSFEEIACGVLTNNDKMYHGAWLDLVNVFHLNTMSATSCQVDGLRFNGSSTDDRGSDLFLMRGNISFCGNGVHQGGGFGGLRTGQINSFVNQINYLFDTTIAARLNREVFYEGGSVCDGATTAGMVFDDALTSNAPVMICGFVGSSGQLNSGTGPYHGIWVKHWPAGRFNVSSGQIFNHKGNGIHVDDVTIVMSIAAVTHIFNNGGWGVYASSNWFTCYYFGGYMANNVLGDLHPNTRCANGTTSSPTITAASGALNSYTSTLRWSTIGKTATWTLFATITDRGTASGALSIQLPFQVRLSVAATGIDAQNNISIHGYLSSNTSIEFVSRYDGTTAAITGAVLVLSGQNEIL